MLMHAVALPLLYYKIERFDFLQFRWFYYLRNNMKKRDVGKLIIIYRDLHTQSERSLWVALRHQNKVWNFGSVTFDITSFVYKVKNSSSVYSRYYYTESNRSYHFYISVSTSQIGLGRRVTSFHRVLIVFSRLCANVRTYENEVK